MPKLFSNVPDWLHQYHESTMSSPKPERQNQRSKTHGESTLNGLRKEKESYRDKPWLKTDHALVLNTFRLLVADLCEQFSGGHLG